MKTRIVIALFTLYVLMSGTNSTALTDDVSIDSIKATMSKRYEQLKKLKKDKIGETYLGYVEAINSEYAKDENVVKIISDENTDREKLYQIIAKETKTTPEVVGKNNASRIFKKAGDKECFKDKEGTWRQKKDLIKSE